MITKIAPPVIWFSYKGDEVCWTGEKYLSILTEGVFNSLEEMDKFWDEYCIVCVPSIQWSTELPYGGMAGNGFPEEAHNLLNSVQLRDRYLIHSLRVSDPITEAESYYTCRR